jgi:2-iminobutanoate/2-iminopropanoate deaminase
MRTGGGARPAYAGYLRDADYAGPNAAARTAALGGRPIPTTAIVAQTLDSDWLVEIEVIAAG